MRTVSRWLLVGCIVVLIVGHTPGVEPRKGAPVVTPTKELLDALLKSYKAYELPFPPADAPLVRTRTGMRSFSKGKYTDHYGLAFLLKSPKVREPDRVFWRHGRADEIDRRQVVTPVEPRPDALKDIDSFVDVELAILCHARGWTELALKVLEQREARLWPLPETELAKWGWSYWMNAFQEANADRATVARQLKLICEHRPDDFTIHDRNKLDALVASLAPGKGKPGTVEALIDGLIDVTRTDQTAVMGGSREPHAAYQKLARRGFEAVPALIEHLNDERLTRARKDGFNNFRGYDYTVADVVCDLLQGLAGEDIGKDWLRRQQGYRLEKAEIEKWWVAAQKVGEEAYLVEHVLDGSDKGNLKNRLMADVLAHKYPKRLPEVYRRLLKERPASFAWELGEVVAASPLPRETKRELFREAARSNGVHARIDGIARLIGVDRADGLEALVAELGRIPESPAGEYWSCPENRLAHLVIQLNEAPAWAALEKAAGRVDVGLRLEFLQRMTYRDSPEPSRKARLAFLNKFLDDTTVRDSTSSLKYDGPNAGSDFPMIEVRNFVAQQLAWFFDMDVEPKKDWTDEQWAGLREDVKKALAREGIR